MGHWFSYCINPKRSFHLWRIPLAYLLCMFPSKVIDLGWNCFNYLSCFSKTQVRDWIDGIARDWKFKRIIPAHFAGPIKAGRAELLAAFAFLDELLGERYVTRPSLSLLFTSLMGKAASYFPPDDMKTLSSLDQFLVSVGAVKKTVSGRKRWYRPP